MPGEQAYYCYGDRSNKYLLINYGFCIAENRYDSYQVYVSMEINLNDLFVPDMVDFKAAQLYSQEIRLKKHQLNSLLMAYLRAVCQTQYQKTYDGHLKDTLLSKPSNLKYEKYCVTYYEQLVKFLQSNLERKYTLEADLETLADTDGQKLSWAAKMALVYRIEKKKIIRNQIELIAYVRRIL